jgi:hypothetical protein
MEMHNEGFNDLYFQPHIISVTLSRSWIMDMSTAYKIWDGKLQRERDYLEDLDKDVEIILKWITQK